MRLARAVAFVLAAVLLTSCAAFRGADLTPEAVAAVCDQLGEGACSDHEELSAVVSILSAFSSGKKAPAVSLMPAASATPPLASPSAEQIAGCEVLKIGTKKELWELVESAEDLLCREDSS